MEKSDHQVRSGRKLPPSPMVAPWFVIPHGKDGKFQAFYNICGDDQLNKTSSKKFIPELSKRDFWQKNCHQGWLIVFCHEDTTDPNYGDCYLWNPQTLDNIQLPSLLRYYKTEDKCCLKDCILTSPPHINTSISNSSNSSSGSSGNSSSDGDNYDKDSMVYVLFDGGLGNDGSTDVLLFCHPGEKEWRRHEVDAIHDPKTMLYLKNKLHIMCSNPVYYEIEVRGGSDMDDDEILAVGDEVVISSDKIAANESTGGGLFRAYVVYFIESFGEVFCIRIWSIPRGIYSNCICEIEIWKLDFASMAWETVKSLDAHVFFISNNTQISCLASDLGFLKGCMYYTQDEEMSLYKYELEEQSLFLSVPCPDLPTPWFQPEWLMITPPPRVDDKRQTTDCILGQVDHMDGVMKVTENIARVSRDDEIDDIEEASQGILASDDFIWSVSNHLHTVDYIHLRSVSKRYRSILNLKRSSSGRTIRTADLSPWLVSSKYDSTVFNFVNPLHNNEKYLVSIPEMFRGFRISFSKGGWFLLSKRLELFLHNPFTRFSIKLPDLPDDNGLGYSGMSFSSLPTSSDCMVFAFNKKKNENVSNFFIKRGEEHWSCGYFDGTYLAPNKKLIEFETGLNNPVFYNGAFYCLDLNGTLGVSKQENGVISWEVLATLPQPSCGFIYESYLVECEGKLLCVLLGHLGKWVRVFRLNEMVWVEVKNLGRHMLCVSNTSCISAVAPTSELENKIYFSRLHEEGILFYSFDTGMYHSIGSKHSARDFRDSKEMLCCSWIEPNWSESSDRFLDWLSI